MKTLTTILILSIALFCHAQDQDICCYSQEKWDARENYFQQREDSLQNIIANSTGNCDSLQALVDYYSQNKFNQIWFITDSTKYIDLTVNKLGYFGYNMEMVDSLFRSRIVTMRLSEINLSYVNDTVQMSVVDSLGSVKYKNTILIDKW